MTRNQFDTRYAATQENTWGYADDELAEINDAVFAQVREYAVDDDTVLPELVKSAFDKAHNAR